jgi:hypothetical protein
MNRNCLRQLTVVASHSLAWMLGALYAVVLIGACASTPERLRNSPPWPNPQCNVSIHRAPLSMRRRCCGPPGAGSLRRQCLRLPAGVDRVQGTESQGPNESAGEGHRAFG